MTTHIALLRGVNVGGHNKVAMGDLRDLGSRLGFDDPRTVLQSGNLVFGCKGRRPERLERLLEAEVEAALGLAIEFFVRTAAEWREVIADNPFPAEAERDPGHLAVMFLKDAPDSRRVAALQAAIVGREVVRAVGREMFAVFPDGMGRSRLTGTLIERKLETRATGRNWNTVLRLAALADQR